MSVNDYTEYETFSYKAEDVVYKKGWYNKILLKSKKPIKDYDENKFYNPIQTRTNIEK
jgi:hypothetical protein